ncbi:hypothetical protein [Clostridium sp. L74]|uniref:hypothetical protein n=1 Tax=Clostridium sp. L74 TaxID=1560217 RepID=UPI0006ABD42E|nr:hypothetical protein [Clostridium sp. L74]KOR24218.1 hypothetical protein ND00_29240 [Clostridium sp. L74]
MLELLKEVLKEGFSLEFKSDGGKINWTTTVLTGAITIIYIISQTKIAECYAKHFKKEYPILEFSKVFIPTIIATIFCFLLMFFMAYFRIQVDKQKLDDTLDK